MYQLDIVSGLGIRGALERTGIGGGLDAGTGQSGWSVEAVLMKK